MSSFAHFTDQPLMKGPLSQPCGGVAVIDATADEVTVLGENKLDDTFNASPAIVGREMYLRGDKSLYCIAEPYVGDVPAIPAKPRTR